MKSDIKSELKEIKKQAELLKTYLIQIQLVHRLIDDEDLEEIPNYADRITQDMIFHATYIENHINALIDKETNNGN